MQVRVYAQRTSTYVVDIPDGATQEQIDDLITDSTSGTPVDYETDSIKAYDPEGVRIW